MIFWSTSSKNKLLDIFISFQSVDCQKEMVVKFATFAVNQEHIPLGESMITMAIKAISVAGMGRFFMDEKEIQKLTSAYEGVCT